MSLGAVDQLWRFPVKSMAGERRDHVFVARHGIPGDRGWALYDETRQGVTNAKRLPALRGCTARYATEPRVADAPPACEIRLPDGATIASDSPECPERLTAFLGRPVGMRRLGAPGAESAPRLTMAGESEATIRALNGLIEGEPMPDLSMFTPERLRQLRHGNFFDAFPIHLITHTTLRTLAAIAPASRWDLRRFRANLVVEAASTEGYPELGWVGRRVRVGGCVLEIVMGCPRCVVVTQAVDELPHDPGVMRTLVREIQHTAGVYATVAEPGDVRPGDPVEFA